VNTEVNLRLALRRSLAQFSKATSTDCFSRPSKKLPLRDALGSELEEYLLEHVGMDVLLTAEWSHAGNVLSIYGTSLSSGDRVYLERTDFPEPGTFILAAARGARSGETDALFLQWLVAGGGTDLSEEGLFGGPPSCITTSLTKAELELFLFAAFEREPWIWYQIDELVAERQGVLEVDPDEDLYVTPEVPADVKAKIEQVRQKTFEGRFAAWARPLQISNLLAPFQPCIPAERETEYRHRLLTRYMDDVLAVKLAGGREKT